MPNMSGPIPQDDSVTPPLWGVTLLNLLAASTYGRIYEAVDGMGNQVIVKVCINDPEFHSGVQALRHFDGIGSVRLLKVDWDTQALLLERISPGTPLYGAKGDEQAVSIAASVMRRLWRPVPEECKLPTLERWFRSLIQWRQSQNIAPGAIPEAVLDRAERLLQDLLPSQGEPVVLHGDIHHWNLLSATREPWLAIDPKGIIGEREFEPAQFLRNPMPDLMAQPNVNEVFARRASQFADEAGLNKTRLLGWAYCAAVLSACWELEEGRPEAAAGELSMAEVIREVG